MKEGTIAANRERLMAERGCHVLLHGLWRIIDEAAGAWTFTLCSFMSGVGQLCRARHN